MSSKVKGALGVNMFGVSFISPSSLDFGLLYGTVHIFSLSLSSSVLSPPLTPLTSR
jgi:hypothetical protein